MHTDKHFPEFRPWNRLVGVSGDLADVIVGMLSWASVSQGVTVISLANFYSLFIQLSKEFPSLIQDPHSVTRRLGNQENFLYSTRLCNSLEATFQLGVHMAGDGRHLEMFPETSRRNLEQLRKRVGDEFTDNLKPLGDRFAEILIGG